jgi:hypothetical protein
MYFSVSGSPIQHSSRGNNCYIRLMTPTRFDPDQLPLSWLGIAFRSNGGASRKGNSESERTEA